MLIDKIVQPWRKARSVNSTDTGGFLATVDTLTEPRGDAGTAGGAAVIDVSNTGVTGPDAVIIRPYGVGAGTNTFSMRLVGWTFGPPSGTPTWIPTVLGEYVCTLGAGLTGVAGGLVLSSELYAGTIALAGTSGNTARQDIISPVTMPAHVVLELKGSMKIQFTFNQGTSATQFNALYRFLSGSMW